jgi:hypothetical protein
LPGFFLPDFATKRIEAEGRIAEGKELLTRIRL